MSYYEGLSCPVCAKAFTPNEDIVVCPQCGLPHHRACWKSIGQCYENSKHGTDQQWSRHAAPQQNTSASAQTNVCPQCQMQNTEYAEFCSRCGTPLAAQDWHSASYQAPPSTWDYASYHTTHSDNNYSSETIDGIKEDELAAVVGNNVQYYMPRFRRMAHGGSGGWNWAAFLFSPYWLFYRKQYLLGSIYLVVFLLTNIVSGIVSASLPVEADAAAMQIAMQEMQNHFLFFPCMALVYIWIAMIVLLAIKGNAFYLSHCKKTINKAHQEIPDITAGELVVRGGISVGMTVLVIVAARICTFILAVLLQNWI